MRRIQTVHLAALCGLLLAGLPAARAQVAIVSPNYIDFGEIKMGAQASVPVELRNLNAAPLNLAGGGFNTSNGFSSNGGSCSSPLPANASCTINYSFRPLSSSETVENSTAILLSGGGETLYAPIAVRGTGGESLIQVTPRSIDFGEELIGQTVIVPKG